MASLTSLSVRRAWIEIRLTDMSDAWHRVALRKESVDRNFDAVQIVIVIVKSLSARRAWIEISTWTLKQIPLTSLSARRAWIEIFRSSNNSGYPASLSARRAWIEIHMYPLPRSATAVALRKESVDRNKKKGRARRPGQVALRKESVDRNAIVNTVISCIMGSLSARRAWIEI